AEHGAIQPKKSSQSDNACFKCQTQEAIVGNERPAEEMRMRKRFVADAEDQIPRMMSEERDQTPPGLPSTAGRQIRIIPEFQERAHSPIEEIEYYEGRHLIDQKHKPRYETDRSCRNLEPKFSLQDQEDRYCDQDVGPTAS